MAFIGIFFLAIFVFVLMAGIFIVFFVSLIISIINLVLGIQRNWPKKNIVLLSIFGSIATILGIVLFIFIFRLIVGWDSYSDAQSYSEPLEVMIVYSHAFLR
jgi:hypothetical protein